jgi:hypothetical protein
MPAGSSAATRVAVAASTAVACDSTRPLAHRLVPSSVRASTSHRSLPGRGSPCGAWDAPGIRVSAASVAVASRSPGRSRSAPALGGRE